jgi:very-short-patch-repair endonuclease
MGFPDAKLLVEVHGGYHKGWAQRGLDETYIELARREGWEVVTVWNDEIDKSLDHAVSRVLASLRGRKRRGNRSFD